MIINKETNLKQFHSDLKPISPESCVLLVEQLQNILKIKIFY